MEGRGGCCIARYAPGPYDMSKVDRIMLRFRPIAPKPVAGGTASDGSSSESSDAFSRCGGAKRKYANDDNSTRKRCNRRIRQKKTNTSSPGQRKDSFPVVTLPLLPEIPEPKDPSVRDLTLSAAKNENENVPLWLSVENRSPAGLKQVDPCWYGGVTDQPPVGVVGSYLTVECVTDTWEDGDGLGRTDEERRMNLSMDTCPGFISDGYGRVTWTNGAYREILGHEGGVWLVMKVREVVPYPSFTCRVRVQYKCVKERSSVTVPCDVWRMDSGGFAWRLDVKAALSLSLGW